MKRILHILTALAATFGFLLHSNAQDVDDLPKLKEVKGKKLLEEISPKQHKNGLWGYANAEGKFTIKPVFTEVCPYEGNIARVNFEGKWGIISNLGLYVTAPKYSRLDEFSADSVAIAEANGRYMIINARGDTLQNRIYDKIVYADYGFKSKMGDKYGTIDKTGCAIFDPQFDVIEKLDRPRGLEHVFKDGKWGIMKDGRDVLTLRFDEKVTYLQKAVAENQPDLYLATMGGLKGVVTSYGQFVVPCVYDDITPSASRRYYVTRSGSKYGAVSLKMTELVAPILDDVPYLGEGVFKVHDDGVFYALNYKGAVEFRNCAGLYQMFKPDEYVVTKTIPEWSKTSLVEENALNHEDRITAAGMVCDILAGYKYEPVSAKADESMPEGFDISIPAEAKERYGIMDGGAFVKGSGTVSDYKGGSHNLLYRAVSPTGYEVNLVSAPSTGELLLTVYEEQLSVRSALVKFNVKEFSGLYPKDFALLPDERLMVRFAVIRTADESALSLFETDSLCLPVPAYDITVHKGSPNAKVETHAVVTYDLKTHAPVSMIQLPESTEPVMSGSCFGGFYTHSNETVIVDSDKPLKRYDAHGVLDWEYRPRTGEKFYGLEETENFIYLCGSTMNTSEAGVEFPLVVQLTKRGARKNDMLLESRNARFTGMICKDHLIYAKTQFLKTKEFGSDYFPHFLLENFGDNFGLRPACAWESWGDSVIGGCGLISNEGKWIQMPVIKSDEVCAVYDWEFSGFTSDFLVFRHHGLYGVLDREGNVVIEPKYEQLELLQNPYYAKASLNDRYGVIDVTGKVVVPIEYDYVGRMNEDVIIVMKDGKYGCFDKTGNIVVPVEHEEIREYVGGMARIRMIGRFGFIDTKGNILVAPFSDEVENFAEGCTVVTIKNKVGMVTFDGDWIVSPMFDTGGSLSGGLAWMGSKGLFGYIDKSGEFVIPQKYSHAMDFNAEYGLACVAMKGRWGVIDRSGAEILPFEHDKVTVSADGYILAEKDGKSGIFTGDGTMVYPIECDAVELHKGTVMFRHGVAAARMDGKRVHIDLFGNVIWQYSTLTDSL